MNISNTRFNRIAKISIAVIALLTIPVRGFAESKQSSPGIVHARVEADVTGDGINDAILLVGYQSELGGLFCRSHEVVVEDGATQKKATLDLGDLGAGYPGSLSVGELDGACGSEIVVAIPTGGSGGITNHFIVSARDGNVRMLVDAEELARGPKLDTRSLDHFTIELVDKSKGDRFLLGLIKPDESDEFDPYSEYYSESGKLLQPIDICIDDVSAAELAPIDGKSGLCEFVTYQKVWAIYHANSVGMIRTAWRYVDGELKIASIDVTPVLVPDAYLDYLESIDHSDPADAVEKAISDYKLRFWNAPPAFRELAFAEFRKFHLAIAQAEAESLERIAGIVDAKDSNDMLAAYARLPHIAADKNVSHAYKRAGLTTVYAGEGLWTVQPRAGFYAEQFGTMLTPSVARFVELDDVERNEPWLVDGALVVSMKELSRRTAGWEAYLESDPYSLFADEARIRFNAAARALLLGTNNTPHHGSDGSIRPEAISALAYHAKAYPGTRSGKAAEDVLQLVKKNANVWDNTVEKEIERVVEAAIYPDERL